MPHYLILLDKLMKKGAYVQDPGDNVNCHETNFKTFTKVWIRR